MLHNVINSMINTTIQPFIHLLSYAKPWRVKIYVASIYSIINKLFDLEELKTFNELGFKFDSYDESKNKLLFISK